MSTIPAGRDRSLTQPSATRPAVDLATNHWGIRAERLGAGVMRWGLGTIFLWFGALKFTGYEASVIAPLIMHSPFLGWLHAALGLRWASNLVGAFELATGVLLIVGWNRPRVSFIGGIMALITFIVTLSLMLTTPGVAEPAAGGFPALSAVPGQFLLKDLGLLSIALFMMRSSPAFVGASDLALRYGLALIFLWFGAMKFTSYEATGIAPFIMNSPLVSWWHSTLGVQGASTMLGIFEITTAVLLVLYRPLPRAAVIGGAMAVLTFVVTLTFLFSTPGVMAPVGFPVLSGNTGQFLVKDLGLLGISIWLLGQALVRRHCWVDQRTVSRDRSPGVA